MHYLEVSLLIFKFNVFVELNPLEKKVKLLVSTEVTEDCLAFRTSEAETDDMALSGFGWDGRFSQLFLSLILLLLHSFLLLSSQPLLSFILHLPV